MRETYGDIWRFHPTGWIVIPTNIGWRARDGSNVMGAGLARQAAHRFPTLALHYGALCQMSGALTPVITMSEERLILFPVKPLNRTTPHLSWQQGADLALIRRSTQELAELEPAIGGDVIAVPWVGCGNGGLSTKDVYPILWAGLVSDRFVLCKGAYGDPRAVGHAGLQNAPTTIFPSALRPNETRVRALHQDGQAQREETGTRASSAQPAQGPQEER